MPSLMKRVMARARGPANTIGFGVRRRLGWSRGRPALVAEDKDELFGYLSGARRATAEERAAHLVARYDLSALSQNSTCRTFRESLGLLDILDGLRPHLRMSGTDTVRAIDVGSRNFEYAYGLSHFFRHGLGERPLAVDLLGIEVDGHGIYRDLHARADYGEAYASQVTTASVRYEVADFLEVDRSDLDVITMFFPFVTRYTLLRWGLPNRLFMPRALLAHAWSQLRPGGSLILFHQTREERNLALTMAAEFDFDVVTFCPVPTDLVEYHEATRDRHAVVLRKPKYRGL